MEYMEDVAPETKANELATIFEGSRGHGGRQIHKIRGQEATADAEQAVNRNESASKLNFVHGCTHDLKQRAANKRMGRQRIFISSETCPHLYLIFRIY